MGKFGVGHFQPLPDPYRKWLLKKIGEVFKNLGSFFGCPYHFNGMKIRLGTALYLQIQIDKRLTWKQQINHVAPKLNKANIYAVKIKT